MMKRPLPSWLFLSYLSPLPRFFFQYHLMRDKAYINVTKGFQEPVSYDLAPIGKALAALFCFLLMLLSVGIPVGYLIRTAGPPETYVKIIALCYTDILYSVVVALIASVIMLFLGFFVALFLERSSSPLRKPLDYLVQVPFAVPPVVLGIGLIGVWNHPWTIWIYDSTVVIVIGYVAHFIPFAIRSIGSGIKQIHPHLEEMGYVSEKRPFRVITRIILPLTGPETIAAFFYHLRALYGRIGDHPSGHPTGEGNNSDYHLQLHALRR